MTEQLDIVELLQKAAGVRSDTDAWLMVRGADEIKRQREAAQLAYAALSSGLRSPAPEALVDTASDIDRARRQGWAQGMKDTLKNIQAAGKIRVSIKCEVCPHEEGCQLCERNGECVIIHRVTAPAPAGEGLSERILVLDQDLGVKVGGHFDGWLMRRAADGQWVSIRKLPTEDPFSATPNFLKEDQP